MVGLIWQSEIHKGETSKRLRIDVYWTRRTHKTQKGATMRAPFHWVRDTTLNPSDVGMNADLPIAFLGVYQIDH